LHYSLLLIEEGTLKGAGEPLIASNKRIRIFRGHMIDSQNQLPSSSKEEKPSHFPEDSHAPQPTINHQAQTDSMEVHKHPHHVMHKKKWGEYLLEFFMLFLAVTLGFVAENLREHFAEHRNGKILAQSLFEDVKKDTASLHSLIAFSNKKISAADSVLTILHSPRNIWNAKSFYINMVPMLTALPFKSTDGTYTQMKTSGTLRYFKQSLVNIINAYDVQLKKTEYRDEVEDKGTWILADLNFNIINVEVFTELRFNKPVTHDMYIKISNKDVTDKFINLVAMNKGFRLRSSQEYQEQLKIADKLIEALQKEYHFE
jgi:hypothetical protein